MNTYITIAVATTCLAGCIADVTTRRIPNVLTFGAAAAALIIHAATGGMSGVAHATLGWLVGAALFFPLFALRGLGAGDVKLLAAVGAWLGPVAIVLTALYAAIAGGVMAVVVGLFHSYLRTAFRNLGRLLWSWWLGGVRPVPDLTLEEARGPRLAYALPITVGAMVMLWLR
jgi:prepilin peptidase CpaA